MIESKSLRKLMKLEMKKFLNQVEIDQWDGIALFLGSCLWFWDDFRWFYTILYDFRGFWDEFSRFLYDFRWYYVITYDLRWN